jgi:Mn-dependent DtxR family transcriptional regulator
MFARLQEMGLVRYERYGGATLTERGRKEALRLVRRHRLIETFLLEHLGYDWQEVHDEAERLEHAVSDGFTGRLAELLGHPVQLPRVVTISLRAAQRSRSCFCIAAAIMPGKRSGVQANVGTPKEAIAAACRRS